MTVIYREKAEIRQARRYWERMWKKIGRKLEKESEKLGNMSALMTKLTGEPKLNKMWPKFEHQIELVDMLHTQHHLALEEMNKFILKEKRAV